MQVRLNPGMDTFAQRAKKRRLALGLSQDEVAKLSGLKQPDISKIELGRIQKTVGILGLARALQCTPDWLESEVGPMESPATATGARATAPPVEIDLDNNPDYPAVRRVSIKAQAGVSGYAVEYMGDDGHPIVFRRDWYTLHNYDPARMLALRVTGESMVPNLYAGDMIVINTAKTEPVDGIAFLVSYEGEVMVKRLVRDDGQWWLASDNADQRRFPRKRCNGETQIIGEVVYRQTERI